MVVRGQLASWLQQVLHYHQKGGVAQTELHLSISGEVREQFVQAVLFPYFLVDKVPPVDDLGLGAILDVR